MVKKDNEEYFLKEEPTKIYYTGKAKTFPSTVAINKLYYFMPYIKEKGVRDLSAQRTLLCTFWIIVKLQMPRQGPDDDEGIL